MGWLEGLFAEGGDTRASLLARLRRDGISDTVVRAMGRVPREEFVPPEHVEDAYADRPLPIGPDATISAPSMVAAMLDALALEPGMRVLEVGLGSGYAAATMAALGAEVMGVEILPELAEQAKANLERAGFADSVEVHAGDGQRGWPQGAPYDRVLVSAAVVDVPRHWVEQLRPGGFLLYPEGGADADRLVRLTVLKGGGFRRDDLGPCRFVRLRT